MKKIAIPVLLAVFFVASVSLTLAAQKRGRNEPQRDERVYIPPEVKTVLEAGMTAKQPRLDIPFNFSGHIFLPAGGSFQNIFSLEIKNADLNFIPASPAPAPPDKDKPAEKKEEAAPTAEAAPAPDMQSVFDLFLQFRNIAAGLPGQVVKEVYVPCTEHVAGPEYNPDKIETYFIGYPLPPGQYLLSAAVATPDLKKIGTQHFEFSTPDPASFNDRLDTTPIFSAKSIERLDAPEARTVLHKGYFTYAILKIIPNPNNVLAFKDNFDIFYFIFGAKPNAEQKFVLETNFEVKKGEETVIRFAPAVMESPLVSLPLPLKYAVLKKTDAGETREEKDLEPGQYTLVIKVLDKVSGNALTKNVDFEVR